MGVALDVADAIARLLCELLMTVLATMSTEATQLANVIDRGLRALWPRRSQQELLLDLGERKTWGAAAHGDAVGAFAVWLRDEMLLPACVPHAPVPPDSDELVILREIGTSLPVQRPQAAVARWITAFAEVLAVEPKTLANSLSAGLQTARGDHRWLRVIARAVCGGANLDAWAYHRRTPDAVAQALARLASPEQLDAGDEMLLLSLVALWHRRRPPAEVKANLRRNQSRRTTPKPVVALSGTLISRGRLRGLLGLSRLLGGDVGPAIAMLALEAAFWEAHLAPHTARRGRSTHRHDGEGWLSAVERVIDESAMLLDASTLGFRVARMRAYGSNAAQPETRGEGVSNAYVEASLALERARARPDAPRERFDPHAPGVFMLIPLLRSRGMLVTP